MTSKLKQASISSFALGMNTRREDFNLRTKAGVFAREITNADILKGGALRRRRGYTANLLATAGHSLWADDGCAFYADGTALIHLADGTPELVATTIPGITLDAGAPVAYATAPDGGAYWTDGASVGQVAALAAVELAPPQPTAVPTASAVAGTTEPGRYTFCFTYVNAAGRESAATHPVALTLTAAQALSLALAGLPPAGYALRVYLSQANGETMYLADTFIAAGTKTLTSASPTGPVCQTVGLASMPAGRLIRYNMGRLWVAAGPYLYYSPPYMPGLYDPVSGYIPFPADITVLERIDGEGTFIVADQTYWLGDPTNSKISAVSPLAASMGSGCAARVTNDCYWMSPRGVVKGMPGGAIKLLQEDNVAPGATSAGTTVQFDRGGIQVLMTAMLGTTVAVGGEGSSYASAEAADPAADGEVWLVNLGEEPASYRYLSFPFSSFALIAGRLYGCKSDGVYLLEGATDNGEIVESVVDLGRQDFGTPMIKRLESAYAHASSEAPLKLRITDDEGEGHTYASRRISERIAQMRFDVGRGKGGSFLAFALENCAGADFELAGVELMAAVTSRRIR